MSANSVEALNTPHIPLQEPPEISLARPEGDLLSLPFDQYGRMRIAQELALALHGEIAGHVAQAKTQAQGRPPTEPFTLRVLDVGGYPGVLPHFLQGDAYGTETGCAQKRSETPHVISVQAFSLWLLTLPRHG